jgi:transaldolase/glucose-6-phosphate isomerase
VLFNSLLVQANRDLATIAQLLGEESQIFDRWAMQTSNAMNEKLWDSMHGIYFDCDLVSGHIIHAHVAAGFSPLYASVPNTSQAELILANLNTYGFCPLNEVCWSVPSYDKLEPGYSSTRYWRGPVWININWILYHGLRNYGFHEYAEYVKQAIILLPRESGFYEYYDPDTGQGYGSESFSWTAALLLDLLLEEETMVKVIKKVQSFGQSIWYDNIRRAMLASGELQRRVENGIMGVTSNPSIFEKAITGSQDYDDTLLELAERGFSPEEIFEILAIEDIQGAADILRPVFERTGGQDGYVSLEVRPRLAHDVQGTIDEARSLFAALDRPNVMIKVPATDEGIQAIETLTTEGVNVNVTLIFSVPQYEAVAEAYISGLEKRTATGKSVESIASVASFFVSRIDTAVDSQIEAAGNQTLLGRIAIANAKVAYARFYELFSGERWEQLVELGAHVQRPLWASTSTKNPSYPDTIYVDSLIGTSTVNTVPPATLQAFKDHGRVERTLDTGLEEATAHLDQLHALDIDLNEVAQRLLDDGVNSFAKSYDALILSIEEKQARLNKGVKAFQADLGSYQKQVDSALMEIRHDHIMSRIWEHDYTVWASKSDEIANRLGWLHSPEQMPSVISSLQTLVDELKDEGYTHALLLGMGGSSLAPEMFRKTFGVKEGFLDLGVLDSTDPGAVLDLAHRLDPARTLFIVATKSGGTVETLSFFKYFYNRVVSSVGRQRAGSHFIAITDPRSKLVETAEEYEFRNIFLNDPNIGGRYSALSYFGLVPAALIGVDLERLLDRAQVAACNCDGSNYPRDGDNLGGQLGAVLGELAKAGRDKLTLVPSAAIASFSDWVEQLIAESTGKNGKGIFPVVGETLGDPDNYGDDRLFVHLRLKSDPKHDEKLRVLGQAGHPVVRLELDDLYDLGYQIFIWEIATGVASYRLGIHPFNQPNVEAAKVLAREMVAEYQAQGALPKQKPDFQDGEVSVYYDKSEIVEADTLGESLHSFLQAAQTGAYVAIQAYVQPTPEMDDLLALLRKRIRTKTQVATTVGYGPRFLHSTGQLHKGDAGKGLFIQFTSEPVLDVPIPDVGGSEASSISFGVLKLAQAKGDRQALLDNDRRVIRYHLGGNAVSGLENLMDQFA